MALSFLVSSFALAFPLYAQTDTLQEVQVKGEKKELISDDEKVNAYSPGQRIVHIDSLTLEQYKYQSVANLLSQQTPAFVKSYGFNGLATLNFRGASAAQSLVLWKGVPLQNAALGITDLSTLPVNLIDRVNIVYGSSSALWGSGNVGGALLLENAGPIYDSSGHRELSVSMASGSYGQYSGGLKVATGGKRWYVSLRGYGQTAKNDFPYTDRSGQQLNMDNSRLAGLGIMADAVYRFNDKHELSVSAWYQNYRREIPPALFESRSLKERSDESKRVMLNYVQKKEKGERYLKAAFIQDKLGYDDNDILNLHSRNISYQAYFEMGVQRNYGRHKLLLFLPITETWMEGTMKSQSRSALSAALALRFLEDRLKVSLQASGQYINTKAAFLPGLNASYSLLKWMDIKANVQRTFRAPTLNELYYEPGGNPGLSPEQGWAAEAGYYVQSNEQRLLSIRHSGSAFYRDIVDWIIWYGGAIWTPHNIARVKSRGAETETKLLLQTGICRLHLGLNTAYIIATTEESYLPGDGSIGKQIPYSPRYKGQLNAGLSYKGLYMNYCQNYTGYRFITSDESDWLEPFSTADVQIGYTLRLGGRSLVLSGQANNIYNKSYEVVAGRPMPGVNWMLGARLSLQ